MKSIYNLYRENVQNVKVNELCDVPFMAEEKEEQFSADGIRRKKQSRSWSDGKSLG